MNANARADLTTDSAPKRRDVSQLSLVHPIANSQPDPHSEQSANNQELNSGDRVESLGSFGKPTGELGTIRETTEDNAVVKWDGDGSTSLRLPLIKKI
jgi:hypothetical protein